MTTVTSTMGVPIDSVGRPAKATATPGPTFGTEQMPAALRAAGLVSALGIIDHGDLDVRLVGSAREPVSGLVAWPSLDPVTRTIRAAVRDRVAAGERPLLLGGCCALLPGAVAGLRDALGDVSVVNVDGHLDLYDARTSPTGEAADVPISALLDRGVPAWSSSLAPCPVLAPTQVALVGYRDFEEAAALGSTMPAEAGIEGTWDARRVQSDPLAVAQAVIDYLVPTPMWIHLDLDVLDESVLPATDYLMPGGLHWGDLAALLAPLVHASSFAGMSVACLNPDKDPDQRCAVETAAQLTGILT